MNITDPLENHRKNLYNFYLACNTVGNSDQSNCSTDNEEDVKDNNSAASSFLPFFNFSDVSKNDNGSLTASDTGNINTKTGITTEVTDCDEFSQIEMKKSDSEERCESGSNDEPEEDPFYVGLSVSDEGKSVTAWSWDSKMKIEKFYQEKVCKSETLNKSNEDKITMCAERVENRFILFRDENKSQTEELLTSACPQEPEYVKDTTPTFTCHHCMKTFRQKSSISRHTAKCVDRMRAKEEKEHLNGMRRKKWTKSAIDDKTCKICGHVARKPCELKLHLSKHTGERPFLCKECGIGFSSTSKLNRHIRNGVHAKGKFYCEPCKIYFTLKTNYERHKSEHSLPVVTVKPFACPKCGRRFSRIDILRKHADVHSQEERELFECMACGRKFSRKDTLSRHISRKSCSKKNLKR